MSQFLNWLYWCAKCGEWLPYECGLVSIGNLTKEEYNYPEIFNIEEIK